MPYKFYSEGMIIDEYIGYPETMRCELADHQVVIIMSKKHIESYPLCGDFEFRFERVYNTIFLLMRYGNSQWMSAPYSPNLSRDFKPLTFNEGEGLALSVFQICNEDGRIYNMSVLGLTTDFSNRLYSAAEDIYQNVPFDFTEHDAVIAKVYNMFKTDEELAEICDEECRCVIPEAK